MKGIELSEAFINGILGVKAPVEAVKVAEPAQKVEEAKKEVEEHICPLCETKLEEAISQEKLQEHVNYFLSVINENFEIDGDSIDEEVEEEAEENVAGQS